MYKVIVTTFGEEASYSFTTADEAAHYIARFHDLVRGAGQVQGRDYDVALEVA